MVRRKIKFDKNKLRKLERSKNEFLSLSSSIISQQISTKAAAAIYKKFLALFDRKIPSPKVLMTFSDQTLRTAGLSRSKIIYLKDLAQKFLDKTIDPTLFDSMTDREIKQHLIQVKGIGSWTADMFLIFALNRPNVFPIGDLGIRKGLKKVFNLPKLPSERQMMQLAKLYDGECTYFSLYLWSVLDE